jgi:branched-chain amino acid transport system substrate-binding protein
MFGVERRNRLQRLWPIIVLLVAGLVATACSSSSSGSVASSGSTGNASSSQPIQIGAILPITGTLSYYGTEYQRGMELAATEINSSGGINGRKVQFTYTDDAGNTSTALSAVRRYHDLGFKIVTGTGSSTTDLTVSQLADQLGMASWVMGTDVTLGTRGLKYMVAPAVTTANVVGAAFAIFKQLPGILHMPMSDITVALVHSNDAYGTANASLEKPAITGYGAKIVLNLPYDITSTDYSSTIAKLKAAAPDVVVQTGYTDDVVLMWKQAKAAGYAPKFMIGSGGTATTNFVKALGSYVNGFAAYSYALSSPKIPASETFAANYKKAYGADPASGHAMMVYSSMLMLAAALKKAGTDDPAALTAAAHSIDAPSGTYPNGCGFRLNSGGINEECTMAGYQWQNEQMVPVYPASIATSTVFGPIPASS